MVALAACATLPNAQPVRSPLSRVDTTINGSRQPGQPLIVLIHGLGSGMGTWKDLIAPLAAKHQVFAYDRPGYGNSGWTNRARTARNIAEELHATLISAGQRPPYLVVGHSLGATYAEAFASLYADETSGMVLIDPTVPRQQRLLEKYGLAQAIFVGNIMLAGSPMPRREFFSLTENDAEMMRLVPFQRGPVTILMANHSGPLSPDAYVAARHAAMAEMAARHRARLIPIDGGHFLHKDRPGAVVEAIQQTLSGSH
jgi:pimeloyl-ACP methyl ester carboxylesterase